jgi:ArsR family transcriptional regulator
LNERRGSGAELGDDLERFYSPGRSWQSLALGLAGLLKLGDVLDVGVGDGAAAATLSPYCRSLTCVDVNQRMVEVAHERLHRFGNVSARVADVHALPFEAASFDVVLMFHTLTYAENPEIALGECARVLRPGGRLVLLCLDQHRQQEITARYGERHAGFSPARLRELLDAEGLSVVVSEVACRESRKPHLQVVLCIAEKSQSS